MKIELKNIKISDLIDGYVNDPDTEVKGYHGKLDIRPPYQREFRYDEKQQQAVIDTILKGFPLNIMYWSVNLLIPLSANASRGDQILNANSFKEHGYSMVLTEEDMNKDTLLAAVRKLYADRHQYIINMEKSEQQDSIDKIMNLIKDNSK